MFDGHNSVGLLAVSVIVFVPVVIVTQLAWWKRQEVSDQVVTRPSSTYQVGIVVYHEIKPRRDCSLCPYGRSDRRVTSPAPQHLVSKTAQDPHGVSGTTVALRRRLARRQV